MGRAIAGRILVTKWVRPSSGRLKLNSERSLSGSVLAHADWYGEQSNIIAEARALMQGLLCCIDTGHFFFYQKQELY